MDVASRCLGSANIQDGRSLRPTKITCVSMIVPVVRSELRAWLRDECATEIQSPLARLRFGQGPVLLVLAGS